MFNNIQSLWTSIGYCLKLAWNSSKFYTIVRLVGNFLLPIFSIATTYIVKVLLDLLALAEKPSENLIIRIALLLCLSFLLGISRSLIQRLASHATTIQNNTIQNTISLSILDKAISADISLYDNAQFYDKFSAARTDSFSLSNILWNVLDLISAFLSLVSSFLILSQTSILYAICITVLIIPSTIANQYYTRKLYLNDLDQMNNQRRKDYLFFLGSTKEYAQEIRCWDLKNFIKKKYTALWDFIIQTKKKLSFHQAIIVFAFSVLPEAAIYIFSIQIAWRILEGSLTLGDYSFYTGMMAQILSSTMVVISCLSSIYANKLKIENLRNFDQYLRYTIKSGNQKISKIQKIEFNHVSFHYPDTENDVLTDVSFSITAPEKVVLVGKNGVGKSTILKLLLRLYDVSDGEILINGRKIQEYNLEDLHHCFGIYFQNSPNFAFTLLENVLLNQAPTPEIQRKIKNLFISCNANDILQRVDQNLDTYLTRMFSDTGIELSEGQHQKLAVIRAFSQDASCYILDEPSSSLDPETEYKIFQCLADVCSGKCVILTSHRLSNIQLADRILVLSEGKIIEQGTKRELLQKENSYFSKLYEYQAQKFKE